MTLRRERNASCGIDLNNVPDIVGSIQEISQCGYHFMCIPIVHPRFKREFISGKAKDRPGSFTRSDMLLSSGDWSNLIVGKLSPYLNVDSPIYHVRRNHEQMITQELTYSSHLGLPAIMFKLKRSNNCNLARIVYDRIMSGVSYQVWVHVPMQSGADRQRHLRGDASPVMNGTRKEESAEECEQEIVWQEDTWQWWNSFRMICNTEKKLGVALELSTDLPPKAAVDRWLGEPVRCLILPTYLFLTNKKGFPVLSRAHQDIIRPFLGVQYVITGKNRHSNLRLYQQYVDHLFQTLNMQSNRDPLIEFAQGYEDYLQTPLQPLMDNLESQTYEIFEKDPVKYTEYQKAMYMAFMDHVPPAEKEERTLVVMVVGAGRGPLVRAALSAARKADRKIKIYAVEKNPNAVVTLQSQQDEEWGDKVTVVSCDMRKWEAPEKADILVSELLGSFGDNELSPECLDGAQNFLKEDGISIPSDYTSYLRPIHSSKLYNEVRLCRDKEKHPATPFEMPYVVHLQNYCPVGDPKPVFYFSHPNKNEVVDNTRYKCMSFDVTQDLVLHGFGGYFETTLYKNVMLSTRPDTHSPGMFSWFPIFFPIKEPVPLRAGDKVKAHFWRMVSKRNVWYEWCISEPQCIPIHNPNGRSYTIGL